MDKEKYAVIGTYVLRVLGVFFVLIYFFGANVLYNLFPGLEGYSLNPVFYTGIFFYFLGALIYYFLRKRLQKSSRKDDENV